MIVLGVDPGLTGAISALHSERGLLDVRDLPTCSNGLATGSMKQWVDVKGLIGIVMDWSSRFDFAREEVHAAIERPIAMPRLPSQTIAAQFDTFGAIRAVMVSALGARRVACISPADWKRRFGLQAQKADSRACALRLYPGAPLTRAKDHNRAESILIGRYYLLDVHGGSVPREAPKALEV